MKYLITIISLVLCWSCTQNPDDTNPTISEDNTTFPDVNALSGSYANMIAAGEHLYVIGDTELITYKQQPDASVKEMDRQLLGPDLESLHYRKGVLFIGSSLTMYICKLDVENIPVLQSRTLYSDLSDFQPCDPIVANDEIAVVSLSSSVQVDEDGCGLEEVDEIRIYDILDISSPELITTVEMDNPKGMALDGHLLFVCEKSNGLKVIDVSEPAQPKQMYHFEGFETYDAVATGTSVLLVGASNLYEYDYSDPNNIHEVWSVKI